MKAYLDIVREVLETGEKKENRTGVDTIAIAGAMFRHDMSTGFPLLTTKKVPFRLIASELEFFIKGITDKQWLLDRNNHIWDEWCSPDVVPYGNDSETKVKMEAERDLGPIYGFQWRRFGGLYIPLRFRKWFGWLMELPFFRGVDQLKRVVETLKKNPNDRRMIVSAWNPKSLHMMALPPCHYAFQVTVNNGKLNLLFEMRSSDVCLGLPFNIASYGLLLHLLAKEAGLKEGMLVGFLADTHIYENHIGGAWIQLVREPKNLPTIITADTVGKDFSIFDWEFADTSILGYEPAETIKFEVAV